MHDELTHAHAVLREFLDRPDNPEGVFCYDEFLGFIFAVVCTPDLVKPGEWIPVVFGEAGMPAGDDEEAQRLLSALMAVYNDHIERLADSEKPLRPDVELRDSVMANFDEDAPVAGWSRGFRVGRHWLRESWDDLPLPDDMQDELAACFMVLTFFSSPEFAREFWTDIAEEEGKSFEEMAERCLSIFEDAAASYAHIGFTLWSALRNVEARMADQQPAQAGPPVGRNDPCPCGSGRKFKKCCWEKFI